MIMGKRGYGASNREYNNYENYGGPESEDKEQTTLDNWREKRKK